MFPSPSAQELKEECSMSYLQPGKQGCMFAWCISSHCKNTDMGPLKKEKALRRPVPWGLLACRGCVAGTHGSVSLVWHRRNIRAWGWQQSFLVLAQAVLQFWCIDPEASRIRQPFGVRHMLTCTARSLPAPCIAEHVLLPPMVVLKKRWGTFSSLDIHWSVCNSPIFKIIVYIFLNGSI